MLIDLIPYKISAWHILHIRIFCTFMPIIHTNYMHKSAKNADVKEYDTIEGYRIPVAGYTQQPLDSKTITLKNNMGEMRQRRRECVARSHRVSKEKSPEEYYMRLLQMYLPW